MRIEEKRATLAIHTLLEKYVDWTATESRCGNCENYDRIWSCPTYDFSVEAFWKQFGAVQLLATKIFLDVDEFEEVDQVLEQVHDDIRMYWQKIEKLHAGSQYLAPGSCHLCPEGCTRKVGAPCRRPDQLRYSIKSHEQTIMVVGLFIFGVGVQGAKIAVDTIVQAHTADTYRGRAFSLYDVLFNTAECVSAGAAILLLPNIGWSRPVQVGLVALVWAVAAGYWRCVRALGGAPRPV